MNTDGRISEAPVKRLCGEGAAANSSTLAFPQCQQDWARGEMAHVVVDDLSCQESLVLSLSLAFTQAQCAFCVTLALGLHSCCCFFYCAVKTLDNVRLLIWITQVGHVLWFTCFVVFEVVMEPHFRMNIRPRTAHLDWNKLASSNATNHSLFFFTTLFKCGFIQNGLDFITITER